MSVKDCKNNIGKTLYHRLRKEEKLPLKYIMFVGLYITNGFNAIQAYLHSIARKGTKYESAGAGACEILKNSKIQNAIRIIMDQFLSEKKLKLDREIINVLYHRAFFKISTFLNPDGISFKKLENIPEEWHCCIDGQDKKFTILKIKDTDSGKITDRSFPIVTYKLADRDKAILELSKYIELYKQAGVSVSMTDETVEKLGRVFKGEKNGKE